MQQLAQQKQALEVEVNQLRGENAKLSKDLKRTEKRAVKSESDFSSLSSKNEIAERNLSATKGRLIEATDNLRELLSRYQDLQKQHRMLQEQKAETDLTLEETATKLRDADLKNLELYKANLALLDLYSNKGPFESARQLEPITGLTRVQIENIVQEYEYRLFDSVRDPNLQEAIDLQSERESEN